jgi:DNA-directed RNA polymerase subunit F
MIRNMQELSMAEVKSFIKDNEETDEKKKELESFIKKFSKLQGKKAEELKKELEGLEILKLKQEYIVKIIDILPEDAADLNKIFSDVSLDEDETNKVLEIVKKYR